MNKVKTYTVQLNEINSVSTQVSFESILEENDVFGFIKLEGYKIYQFIDNDFLYNMQISELDEKSISYSLLNREKKIWFGLVKKTISDVLIHPADDFFYPYSYGNYLYLFTKENIKLLDFQRWIEDSFPNRFTDFKSLRNPNTFESLHRDDYVIVTDHDYQKDFTISASKNVITRLKNKLMTKFDIKIESSVK